MIMAKDKIYLFCDGEKCLLKDLCQRYVLGRSIDAHAPGFSWMPNCNVEDRNAFISTEK